MNWLARIKTALARRKLVIEFCHDCGTKQPLVWRASNDLWREIMGSPNGVVCPRCFDRRATAKGLSLEWRPIVIVTRLLSPDEYR